MKFPSVCFALLHLASTSHAFVVTPRRAAVSLPRSVLAMAAADEDDLQTSSSSTATAPAIARRSDLDKGPAKKMDEAIFKFNKTLIDTVYDIICFLYPVKGNERDFARFYVLETVARVPYFAYLSVLHLRETFGDRESSDKMRSHYAEADNGGLCGNRNPNLS